MAQIAGIDMPEFQSDPVVGLPASYSKTHFRKEKKHTLSNKQSDKLATQIALSVNNQNP
jgi:hypothetical protein